MVVVSAVKSSVLWHCWLGDLSHATRHVPDRDFHYPAGTRFYRIPDTDVRTVRHIDNWVEATTPSEWGLSAVIVWHGQANNWYPVYTIQPVVQPVWQPAVSCKQTSIWLLVGCLFTRYSRSSKRFDNRVERSATVCSTGCQTGLYNWFDNLLYTWYNWLSNRFQTGLTTVVSCKRGLSELMCYYTEIAIFSCLFTTLHRMTNSTQLASMDSGCERTRHPASNISLVFQLTPYYIT